MTIPRVSFNTLRDVSIARKLLFVGAASAVLSMLVAGTVLFGFQAGNLRQQFQNQTESVARIVASYAGAPVSFGDADAANEVLSRVQVYYAIDSASLLMADGTIFATHGRPGPAERRFRHVSSAVFNGWTLEVSQPVRDGDRVVATLWIGASFERVFFASLNTFILALLGVIAIGSFVSIATTIALRGMITGALERLAALAKRVADERDYSLRASVEGRDEVGELTGAFNGMLARIEAADRDVRTAYVKLEEETRERTRLHDDLIKASRLAGMAEVATGVLHNVGNVLNTVNLSAHDMQDRLSQARVGHLRQGVNLLASQNGNLASFLHDDPRGRALPEFLVKLTDYFEDENKTLQSEVATLVHHVEHIKEIVSTQQSYARVMGVTEQTTVMDLVTSALKLSQESTTKHAVTIDCTIEKELPLVVVDRHRVVQVLVNLVANAKDSVKEARTEGRRVQIDARLDDEKFVLIRVTDNGMGIERDNLPRIFRHGFTTKATGHGFGLHMSAIAAREMGGSLEVDSEGPGKGASFTLKVPAKPATVL